MIYLYLEILVSSRNSLQFVALLAKGIGLLTKVSAYS